MAECMDGCPCMSGCPEGCDNCEWCECLIPEENPDYQACAEEKEQEYFTCFGECRTNDFICHADCQREYHQALQTCPCKVNIKASLE